MIYKTSSKDTEIKFFYLKKKKKNRERPFSFIINNVKNNFHRSSELQEWYKWKIKKKN